MEKKGQFYLIAAMILGVIIVAIATASNFLNKNPNTNLQVLKEEIQTESSVAIDYTTYNELSQQEFNDALISFTQYYIDNSPGINLYFLFGDQTNLTLKGKQETENQITFEGNLITSSAGEFISSINPSNANISLQIGETSYGFELTAGKSFYFIISKESNEDLVVLTGQVIGE